MSPTIRRLLFTLFFASGFCGLLYQVVWVRMAFAAFGIMTPVLSVVISVFMLGLALGTWVAGKAIGPLSRSTRTSPILYYGLTELLVAFGAVVVPACFSYGENFLLEMGETSSSSYLVLSATFIALSLLPWCFLMGATFPLMMAFIKEHEEKQANGFSYLYFANVIGAMTGTILTAAVIIEFLGFTGTLRLAAVINITIALISLAINRLTGYQPSKVTPQESGMTPAPHPALEPKSKRVIYGILFLTGFTSMAMEVVWTRAFTPILKTTIYAFAGLLASYLLATWLGSQRYRKHLAAGKIWGTDICLGGLTIAAFLPLLANDPRLHPNWVNAVFSLFPFCALLGYLTPKLIDQYSRGFPQQAGNAYALNIVGGILGPLAAGYVLLPYLGVRGALIVLSLPYVALFAVYYSSFKMSSEKKRAFAIASLAILVGSAFIKTFEDGDFYSNAVIHRDHTATVISSGEGREKRLYVNGVGITHMTPVTKLMAHFPILAHAPGVDSALVICFGMGTTFRSLMSWGINATAVELVPSVRDAFPYYFSDAAQILKDPRGKSLSTMGEGF